MFRLGVKIRKSHIVFDTVTGGQGDTYQIPDMGAQRRVLNAVDSAAYADECHLAVDHGYFQSVFHQLTVNRLKTLKEIFIRSSFGIDCVPDTSFQITHQLLGGKLIRFCHILDGTKPLKQAADAVGIPFPENRIGLRPFLQNIFHGHLGEREICVHVTQNTTSHRFLLCAGANRRESKKHAGMRAITGSMKKAG